MKSPRAKIEEFVEAIRTYKLCAMRKLKKSSWFYINTSFIYLLLTKFFLALFIYIFSFGYSHSDYIWLGILYFVFGWLPAAYLFNALMVKLILGIYKRTGDESNMLKPGIISYIVTILIGVSLILLFYKPYIEVPESIAIYIFSVLLSSPLVVLLLLYMPVYDN